MTTTTPPTSTAPAIAHPPHKPIPPNRILYVTGLPRSGATLLCQLLHHHPDIDSPGAPSPLCAALVHLRQHLSHSDALLTQLNHDVEATHEQLLQAYRGFIQGWLAPYPAPWVADHSQDWLAQIEMVKLLEPEFRMVVCVRELGQIYGSLEAHRQKVPLLDWPGSLAGLSRPERAMKLFEQDGLVGTSLTALDAVQDLDAALQSRLYYVIFEHLLSDPLTVMADLYRWLGLPIATFDPQNLTLQPRKGRYDHHFQYAQIPNGRITPLAHHAIPQRFDLALKENFTWYYQTFYPGLI